jgi:octaprenyl-diphosphate synthase
MDLADIRAPVDADMAAVDRLIRERLRSDVVLINQLGEYIVGGGGKRLRPLVVLLTARAAGHRGEGHILLAAIVELIHTATLLHDDVVDESAVRRGRQTANNIWGNEASVLVGDFLYTRAFQMMVELERLAVLEAFAGTTNTIAEGEVLQLLNVHDPDVTEERYRDVIYRKTAALFEAGCRLAAHISDAGERLEQAAAAYGRHIGVAFQLIDDALDYDGDAARIGKNIGDDLAEGKPTLPLIRTLATASETDCAIIREAVEQGGRERLEAVRRAIASTDAIPYTRRRAEEESRAADLALQAFPDTAYRQALARLARFAVSRDH